MVGSSGVKDAGGASRSASGQYSCTVLQGWSGTVTPTFSGFSLTPASRDHSSVSANLSAQDYTASSSTQVSASPTAAVFGGTLTATWSGIAAPSTSNSLGLYAPGSSTQLGYRFLTGAASGSVPFILPTSMAQGTYQLRLFTPGSALLAISNSFTAGAPMTVSGTVTSSGTVLAGVTFTATNGGTCTASNASGQYSCTVLQGWSGSVTPSSSSYGFTPASRAYSNMAANQTAQDYTAAIMYVVSGTVTLGGSPFAGVAFAASNGGVCTASNASGQYSCAVPQGYTGTVTPSSSSYAFTPASHSYSNVVANQTAQDYTAAITYVVGGTVTLGGSPFAGAALAATNGGTCTSSNASGQYSCTVVQGWSGSVTPSASGYAFTPASRNYTNVAAGQSAQNFAGQAITASAGIFYIHPDHLNTPRMIADSTGTTVWRWDQGEPFGNDVPNSNPSGAGAFDFPLRLPGQYYDKETALHYNMKRDYDSGIGRYVESDPLGIRAGLDTFAYVGSSPLLSVDPDGLINWKGTFSGAAGGLVFGFGAYYFTVTSECACGYRVTITGYAVAFGAYAGVSPKIPVDLSKKSTEFFDSNECPDPDAATGSFRIREISALTAGNSKIQLGSLNTFVPEHFLEPDLSSGFSAGQLSGHSWGTGRKECCK